MRNAVPGALHQRADRRDADLQRERQPDQPFAADQPDFERLVLVHHGQQGNERVGGKVDLADRLARLVQDVAVGEFDRLHGREHAALFGLGQGGEHAVCGR